MSGAVCRLIQNTFIAFVVATLWPKPHLNRDSEAMGTTYAAILFFSLVRSCCSMPEPWRVHKTVLFTMARISTSASDICGRVLTI